MPNSSLIQGGASINKVNNQYRKNKITDTHVVIISTIMLITTLCVHKILKINVSKHQQNSNAQAAKLTQKVNERQ